MKGFGNLLTLVGLVWLIWAFNMETVVSGGYGEVHNIGLMEERQNHLILAGLTLLIGIIMFGFGTVVEKQSEAEANSKKNDDDSP